MIAKGLSSAFAVLALILGLATGSARADIIPFDLTGTGWHIEFDPAKVISPSFAGTPDSLGRGKDGDLDFDGVIFKDFNPIEIRFVQDRDTPNDGMMNPIFGLRITLRFDISNESGLPWDGFVLDLLKDPPAEFDSGENLHPGFAHFHGLPPDLPQSFLPFTLQSPANPSSTNRGDVYVLSGGRFENNTSAPPPGWTGIGIHQWEVFGDKRDFTLRLTPLPEPSSVALLGIGSVSLIGYGWRCRKRRGFPVATVPPETLPKP